MFIAAEVTDKMVTDLAKPANRETIAKCDAFLKNVLVHYAIAARMEDPPLCGHCMKVTTQLLTRVGSLFMHHLKPEDVKSAFPKIEAKFVHVLTPSLPIEHLERFPSLIFAEAQQFLDEDRKAEAKK